MQSADASARGQVTHERQQQHAQRQPAQQHTQRQLAQQHAQRQPVQGQAQLALLQDQQLHVCVELHRLGRKGEPTSRTDRDEQTTSEDNILEKPDGNDDKRLDALRDTHGKIFSALDLHSAYHVHQVEVIMNKDDRIYTAFQVCNKSFRWKRMPFGLTNAQEVF